MTLRDLDLKHVWLIGLYAIRYAIRSGTGLVFGLLVLAFGLLTAQLILAPVEEVNTLSGAPVQGDTSESVILGQLIEIARPVVAWMLGAPRSNRANDGESHAGEGVEAWASFLLDDRPAPLSAVFLIVLFGSPFLIVLGAFNQFSGDIQSRGLRFQLLHAERGDLFFGRFLGSAVYAIAVMGVLITIIALYLGIKIRVYPVGPIVLWSLRGWFALAITSVPYVALCSWMSSMIDSPFGSLTISFSVVGVVPLIALLGGRAWGPAAYLKYALPWGIQSYLLHPGLLHAAGAAMACLSYALIFLILGRRHLQRRDV